MTAPAVSVIIVSRGRPDALRVCLTGVGQLAYPNFEIVIVADPEGIAAVGDMDWARRVKLVAFDEPNISVARNLGIAQTSGEIIAFIDDDAVPEPTWLMHLCAPFEVDEVAAAGGFVIGRNGISYQWKARWALANAATEPLEIATDEPAILQGEPGRAIKTEGTNMAFRRDVLVSIGGFDPAFAFYLDETDVNLRIAETTQKTAIVPLAIVHHGFAASARRTAGRVPKDLHQIGASIAAFLRKHAPDTDMTTAHDFERQSQRKRLLSHMVSGGLEPRDVDRILATFDAGWNDGVTRKIGVKTTFAAKSAFRPVMQMPDLPHKNIIGRFWQKRRCFAEARAAISQGQRTSVYLFSLTARYHRVQFQPDGFWLQQGGQFGKSLRDDKAFAFWVSASRFRREIERVVTFRQPNCAKIGELIIQSES